MPNVTIFLPPADMPPDAALCDLTHRCVALCTDILEAAEDTVHVIYVPVRHGRGHPVFAEIRYRCTASRTPEVFARFMEGLDAAIRAATGCTPRIRCFGSSPSSLHARN